MLKVKNSQRSINSILEFYSKIRYMSGHPQEIPIFKKNYLIMITEFRSLKSPLLRGKQLLKGTILSLGQPGVISVTSQRTLTLLFETKSGFPIQFHSSSNTFSTQSDLNTNCCLKHFSGSPLPIP